MKPNKPLIAAICVVGFAITVFGPIVGYRMIFTSSFTLSCLQHGGSARMCECAADKTLELASLTDIFDGERMKVVAQSAVADCR